MDSKKHKRNIMELISRPCKPPSSNKDEAAEAEEEEFNATQASTEDKSPINTLQVINKLNLVEGADVTWARYQS